MTNMTTPSAKKPCQWGHEINNFGILKIPKYFFHDFRYKRQKHAAKKTQF